MHCPYCAAALTQSPGCDYLECAVGNMGLSKKLKDALTDVYELGTRPPKPNHFDFTSGRWFCPKCAVHLEHAASGKYECPTCNRTIGEFVYELVEFHPHLGK